VAKLAKRPSRWVGLPAAPTLGSATREFMLRRSFTLREFIMAVLLPCVRVALEFPALFATTSHGCAVVVNQPTASFTRQQVWCLLSNMFFCTLRSRTEEASDGDGTSTSDGEEGKAAEWVDARLLPTTDYAEVFTAPEGANNVEVTKLLLLFDFFMEARAWTAEQQEEVEMTAHRTRVAPEVSQGLLPRVWCSTGAAESPSSSSSLSLPPLSSITLHPLGESIDDQHDMVRLDFANRWIGGGALSGGAVQEEITFAQCPALNVLRWYQSRLGHAESVVVTDYRQYGCVMPGTYGSLLRYGEAFCPPRPCRGALLAVDALDFRFDTVDECSQAAIYREVMKLVSGLSSPALMVLTEVAGGNWGCGVFGGDYELKFLIQWAACGVAGKTLHYFPFDNNAFDYFISQVNARLGGACSPPLTTANLISFLYTLEDASDVEDGEDTAGPQLEMRGGEEAKAGVFGFVWAAFLRHFRLPVIATTRDE
jgi:hypothetical protein